MSYDEYPALKAFRERNNPTMAYNECIQCGSKIKLLTTNESKAKFEQAKRPVCNICFPASQWSRTYLLTEDQKALRHAIEVK